MANHADFGAGVVVRDGVATMAVLRVENNGSQTDAQGGGLGCVDSDLVLYGSVFSRNRAGQGGGLHATGCEISGGTFEANSASSAGSAVLAGSMLFQATVTADPAGAASSSVWLREDAALVETRVEGYVGAGAAIEAGADARIVGGEIIDNTCGLRVTGTVVIEDTSILRNDAGACIGGASELEPGLVSVAADWGTGSDDNGVDVRWDADYTAYGADASFSCAEGCD